MIKATEGGYLPIFTARSEPVAWVTLYLTDKNTFGDFFSCCSVANHLFSY